MPNAVIAPSARKACLLVTCAFALACHARADLKIMGDARFDGQRVTLVAARGEVLRLLVFARDARLDLPGVRAYSVEHVRARRASTELYGGGAAGEYPDVLAPAGAGSPAYFEITADASARGTLYAGARAIPVELTVAAVQLPALPPRVWAYYDPRELGGTAEAPSAHELACIAEFRRHGVALSPDLPIAAWPARRRLLGDFPYVPVTLSDRVADDVHAWIAATRGTGKLPFAIPIDEPRTAAARLKVRALAAAVRAAGGGPSTFLFAVTDEPHAEYGNLIDLYITLRAHRADRFSRWTYNGAPPRAGSFVLDAAPPGPRTWGWIGWRWQIPVWYVWDALYWHDRHNKGAALDIAHDATSFDDGEDHGNLDGVLALPGDDAQPCRPTLRLAAIGRAMQDRSLIELAASRDRAATEQLVERMVPRALGDAGDAPAWPRDDAAWETARRQLLRIAATP